MIGNGTVLVLSVAASLLCAEALLRLTTDADLASSPPDCERIFFGQLQWLAFDPVFGWRNRLDPGKTNCEKGSRPTQPKARINRHGFRGAEIEPEKPAGVIRIVCMGDSGTFGVQALPDEANPANRIWRAIANYPEELARRLEREGLEHVEVINAGVIGYSTSHGLRLLILRVLDLDPDIVTVRFGANDSTWSWAPQRRTLEPSTGVARAILYGLHDWRLMRLALHAYQGIPSLHPEPNSVRWSTEQQFRRNLERMRAVTREHDVRLLLLDYPVGSASSGGHLQLSRLPALQAILHDFSRDNHVPLLMTRRHLSRSYDRFFDESDTVHPNERGARLIGDLLFEKLRDLGWLEPPSFGN